MPGWVGKEWRPPEGALCSSDSYSMHQSHASKDILFPSYPFVRSGPSRRRPEAPLWTMTQPGGPGCALDPRGTLGWEGETFPSQRLVPHRLLKSLCDAEQGTCTLGLKFLACKVGLMRALAS